MDKVGPFLFNFRVSSLADGFPKLKSYEEVVVDARDSRASSPGASGSGSESHSSSHSRSCSRSRPASLAFTGIAQAAKRYRHVGQSLDFTATVASTGDQSLEDEVNHYMTSPLPSRKSMDMVGYWMVCFSIFQLS